MLFVAIIYKGKCRKRTIIAESGEGTMHNLRKIAVAEPWGTECKVARQKEYSFHMEVRTLYARCMFRE